MTEIVCSLSLICGSSCAAVVPVGLPDSPREVHQALVAGAYSTRAVVRCPTPFTAPSMSTIAVDFTLAYAPETSGVPARSVVNPPLVAVP